MAVFIFHLGVCVMAAFGADAVIEQASSIWVKRVTVACGAVAIAIWIYQAVTQLFHVSPRPARRPSR